MTHKRFYARASEEVADGKVDSALWVKVCADHGGLSDRERQAKYVQARAQELADQKGREWVAGVTRSGAYALGQAHWMLRRHRKQLIRAIVLATAFAVCSVLFVRVREAAVTRDHILDVNTELEHMSANSTFRGAAEDDMSDSCYKYEDIWASSLNKVPGALDDRIFFLCEGWFGRGDHPWDAQRELSRAAKQAGDDVEASR